MQYQKILYHSIVGDLTILSDDHYIRKIEFGKAALPADTQWSDDHPILLQAERQLLEYFAGMRQQFELPLTTNGTAFQQTVWNALRKIPYGETMTYGQLAKIIGCPNAARAVGGSCNKNPIAIVIPCHRVVGADGKLTGFAAGISIKERLLLIEHNNKLNNVQNEHWMQK